MMLGSVLILTLILVLQTKVIALTSAKTQCSCGYRQSGSLLILRCTSNRDDLPPSTFRSILCQRVGDTVRIGDSTNLEISKFTRMTIEPFGLSQLQEGGRVTEIQINLPLQGKLLDSFTFAGLPDLVTLQAWREPIALESCSLAGLPRLENLVISCNSTFDGYLSFGSAFKSIRLTGCSGRPLQFICSQCTQRPEISVLRILPGPPSSGGIVYFETKSNSSQSSPSVALHTCHPGVCSDDHLCRHNYPLKMVRSSINFGSTLGTTVAPITIAHSQFKSGHRFLTIFLPILLMILAISTAACIFISLRIIKLPGKKGFQSQNQTPQTANWTNSIPLNDFSVKV